MGNEEHIQEAIRMMIEASRTSGFPIVMIMMDNETGFIYGGSRGFSQEHMKEVFWNAMLKNGIDPIEMTFKKVKGGIRYISDN